MPLRRGNVNGFWLVENKHLAFAAFVVGASMYALRTGIKNEVKELRTEIKNDIRELRMEMKELRTEIKNDIRELRMEIRTSLTALSRGDGCACSVPPRRQRGKDPRCSSVTLIIRT